uniref:5'-3' exoribonuclease n=1 Tax=Trichuris muris TaxID=70415 RepID=A0A5S6QFH9_TRIMR
MGVPAFFRWLSCKYPSIVVSCIEEKKCVGEVIIPVNCCEPNPHGIEFDNLYLDMNGIIHPCCHPEDKPAPKNEDEMMVAIFEYIDRLFNIVRPRRLLYMAIDGVAPRAKMNQQRSRRFRASKEVEEKESLIKSRRQEMELQGIPLPPVDEKAMHFDSNCITPGTPFMARLADCLRYYINDRLNSNLAWKNVAVILSDASVPGEGEHKIMDFIRRQRASATYDPNLQHVICGADADLIMLGLATHEPHFTIIREEFIPNRPKPCDLCHRYGHSVEDCEGLSDVQNESENPVPILETAFIFIRLSVLREYLKRDLEIPNLPFPYDFEKVVDDWVFMCFFVGNDFLPHLPSLEIREGAIDRLIKLYKNCVYKTGGYLTEHGILNLARVQVILNELGAVEDEIFRHRQQNEVDRARRAKSRRLRERGNVAPKYIPQNSFAPMAPSLQAPPVHMAREVAYEMRRYNMTCQVTSTDAKQFESTTAVEVMAKAKATVSTESEDEEPGANDEVRLWETGWKERYFLSKMQAGADEPSFRYRVAFHYVEGLCWVLRYYYQGCASWNWFYPFHYSPFASDFVNIGDMNIVFPDDTKPIAPFEQLMSVFPPASRAHLPLSWGELMINPNSPIIDFYPSDFKIDLNGKRFAWQGVALLPFVEAERLKETLTTVYPDLSVEERKRNSEGNDVLFVSSHHPVYAFVKGIYENDPYSNEWIQLDASLFHGTALEVSRDPLVVPFEGLLVSPVSLCPDIRDVRTISCLILSPRYPKGFLFPSKLLDGAKEPPAVLKPQDWNEKTDGRFWPTTGFTRGARRMGLSAAGHRMLTGSIRSAIGSSTAARDGETWQRGFSYHNVAYGSGYDQYRCERSHGSQETSAFGKRKFEQCSMGSVNDPYGSNYYNSPRENTNMMVRSYDEQQTRSAYGAHSGNIFPAYVGYASSRYPPNKPIHWEQQPRGSPYNNGPAYPPAHHSWDPRSHDRQRDLPPYDRRFHSAYSNQRYRDRQA